MIKIEHSLEKCHQLWEKFSPKRVLWDEWDINECFYATHDQKLMFMHTDKSLLPLSYDFERKRHQFFSNTFIENRTFWIDNAEIPEFFNHLPENVYLHDINGPAVEALLKLYPISGFEHDDYRNFWNKTNQEFLALFSSNNRNAFLRQMRKLDYVSCTLESNEFAEEGFELFITLNKLRFGEESDFHDQNYLNAWKKMCKLPFVKFLVARTDKIVGINIVAIYKNVLYVLGTVYDADLSGLGKLLTWQCFLIKESHGLDEVDFMAGINDWKSRFHLAQEKYYSFKR